MAKPVEIPRPMTAPIGSIMPEPIATSAAFKVESPVARNARATARPSGMSWMAMALVNGRPTFRSPLAKLTPMAMPSGRLCRVMASTNSHTRLIRSACGPQGPVLSCSCGVKRSRPSISNTPSPIPMTTVMAA
ncbi:hypothetical protein D3C79_926980 [compost metagenome]